MDDLTIARALHVLAIVHWIGGVSMVTLVLLPGLIRTVPASERLTLFELIEGRFAFQARISTVLAGASGFWMTHRLAAWDRFADPRFWWMHAMVAVWAILRSSCSSPSRYSCTAGSMSVPRVIRTARSASCFASTLSC